METEVMNNGQEKEAVDPFDRIIEEIGRQDEGQSNKLGSWTLLIITVMLFFSAGILSASAGEILILILVIFFHELGHMAAMKLLKYNDVKMFFIPLLGAAVSGKSKNESAFKSCIVSLMGPFPGIIMGIILTVLFGLTKNYYILKAAEVMMLLNAFNFLPIMPLDGGRYVDVLFVNNRYFRLVFSLFGAVIFFLLAYASSDFIIAIIGVFLIFGSITSFKINSVSLDLKNAGVNASSWKELSSNREYAEQTIGQLRLKFPKIFKPEIQYKAVYTYISEIISNLKFIPAKFMAKISLVVVYLVILFFSILTAFVSISINYNEQIRVETIDGIETRIVEKYAFGTKTAELPVDQENLYDGKGLGFYGDSKAVKSIFFYEKGFRTGEWLEFDQEGQVLKRTRYEEGKFLSEDVLEDGHWATYMKKDLSLWFKLLETISEFSQPYKTIYHYFD